MRTRCWYRGGRGYPPRGRSRPFALLSALILSFALASVGPQRASCAALSNGRPFPENAGARALMRDTIFAPARQAAAAKEASLVEPESGETVQFLVETERDAFYFVFLNASSREASVARPGSFIIKRSRQDGSFLQAKVFLQNDEGCFARMFPSGEDDGRVWMDLYLFGEIYRKHVPVPISFEALLTAPFSRIMELTRASIDWQTVLGPGRTSADARLSRIADELRGWLPSLRDRDDGAMDASGSFVYIETGKPQGKGGGFNCSGFAKWVMDAFYRPLTGLNTDIETLKVKLADSRGNAWSRRLEEQRDPYFGLDWSRNLARVLVEARTGMLPASEDLDVRGVPGYPYVEDVGFEIGQLPTVLYLLRQQAPGELYLASINGPWSENTAGGATGASEEELLQHHHLAVMLPFVDEAGKFRVVVMERNVETSLESLAARYAGNYAHLVRVESTGLFAPPSVD